MDSPEVLATFFGDKDFPVEWKSEEEKKLFWFYDDNHVPFPITPMYFSMNGWWGPTCDYMFRRLDAGTGVHWHGKVINGYLYSAVEPRAPKDAKEAGKYFDWIMPTYATNFLDWWEKRYLPEVLRNFDYIDNFDAENATMHELMVYLEDMYDIQERHFRLHWILNMAQFTASGVFNATANELVPDLNADVLGKVNISSADRNWDSLKALWHIKERVKADSELSDSFKNTEGGAGIAAKLDASAAGKALMEEVVNYAQEFGYKTLYTHEYIYPLYVEDPTPILEQIQSHLTSDFDYNALYDKCIKEQSEAIAFLRQQIAGKSAEEKKEFERVLELNLRMQPLTPDHHFYFDQGTFARMRLVLMRVARKMVKEGLLDDREDILFLEYEPLRRYVADPKDYPGRKLIEEAKAARERAFKVKPRDWVGTVTQENMYEEPYHTLWGYPEKFEREQEGKAVKGEIRGLGGSPGIVEGVARIVKSPQGFASVKQGEIMVCLMTNPAWVVVFSRIVAIVTDSGGVLSHSATVAREFMIPSVVGTGNATTEIKNGDRIRVDGDNGVVTIL